MGTARILLVEDNPVIQVVVRRMLELLGGQVDLAENGHEALVLISKHRYDLVLMDCLMPRMDGFEAARRIRSLERVRDRLPDGGRPAMAFSGQDRIPIVAITTNAESRELCLECGMDDHLRKPFGKARLCATLDRWLPQEVSQALTLSA